MTIPRATYRLQFHRGFTLRDALRIVPYLSALGVSHVYASPLLKAQQNSTHGYDTCDPTQINPEIGTEADLDQFVAALREQDMGLVLDIVPNHMAAVPENPWWWDVLKHGRQSRFADYFDINWDGPNPERRGKVLLPVLGDELERVLDRGELTLASREGEVTLRYFDHRFPIHPKTLADTGKFPVEALAQFHSNRQAMKELLDRQHYRLAWWRHGDSELNYRRFFTITHLAGVRVELPQVFADTHRHILDWCQRGLIDGLRVDHPDGLRDPQDYLCHLRKSAPGIWIVVEKILEPGENLPADWPVDGTTGYDFLARLSELFIDPAGEKPLTEFYASFTGEPTDYATLVREKKRWILQHQLVAEVERLTRLLVAIQAEQSPPRPVSPEESRRALIEIIACFPVYRCYMQAKQGSISDTDRGSISQAIAGAIQATPPPSPVVLDFLGDLLRRKLNGRLASDFVMRFQQLTGPAMAKGAEDTSFYCFNRFAGLNEVGSDPARFGISVNEFHLACRRSHEHWPNTMLATSTHDTKRSEDVRARLALLSEIPELWTAAVRRWSAMNEKHRCDGLPDRNAEYLFYQTLAGAWPLPLDRALAYMEKASREAKQHTGWTDPDVAYDDALKHFVAATLGDPEFTGDLQQFVAPLIQAGQINSLAQTLLKLTAPGVPDIYQGTELWDLSLVDPDNRRPVDFATRTQLLAGSKKASAEQVWQRRQEGLPKLWLIEKSLRFRREHPDLFGSGSRYKSLEVRGRHAAHALAFARVHDETLALTVVPRLPLKMCPAREGTRWGHADWEDTCVALPINGRDSALRNVLTGEQIEARVEQGTAVLRLTDVLVQFPVALIANKEL